MSGITDTYHRTPYSSIDPSQFDYSDHCIAIIGCSSSISQSIASSFCEAKAKRIILAGRTTESIEKAVAVVRQETACSITSAPTYVEGRLCDLGCARSIDEFWNGLKRDHVSVHVLILVAAHIGTGPISTEAGVDDICHSFKINVVGNIKIFSRFIAHENDDNTAKVLLNMSSAAVHMHNYKVVSGYGASKMAFAHFLQSHADEVDPARFQIINYHPGAILTQQARKHDLKEESLLWDDVNVVSGFSVWAATPAALHLHGRFLWANWDVDEICSTSFKGKLKADPGYLRLGLQGLHPESGVDFAKILVPAGDLRPTAV